MTVVAVVLTFASGASDVASFTRLGNVFSSVMTGNITLFGLSVARGSGSLAAHTTVAFAGYVVGVVVGDRAAVGRPADHAGIGRPLAAASDADAADRADAARRRLDRLGTHRDAAVGHGAVRDPRGRRLRDGHPVGRGQPDGPGQRVHHVPDRHADRTGQRDRQVEEQARRAAGRSARGPGRRRAPRRRPGRHRARRRATAAPSRGCSRDHARLRPPSPCLARPRRPHGPRRSHTCWRPHALPRPHASWGPHL